MNNILFSILILSVIVSMPFVFAESIEVKLNESL